MLDQETVDNAPSALEERAATQAADATLDILRWLRTWDGDDLIALRDLGKLMEHNRTSEILGPVEDALVDMIGQFACSLEEDSKYEFGFDEMQATINEKRDDFERAIKTGRHMFQHYPRLLQREAN